MSPPSTSSEQESPQGSASPSTTSIVSPAAPGQEFRSYRRFVALVTLTFIIVLGGYLLASVGVTIYRQRHALSAGAEVGANMSLSELRGCLQELADVSEALEKHLENSHYLLGGYDQEEVQRWANEGTYWRNQWKVLGDRCRLSHPVPAGAPKELDEMVGAYRDLADTAVVYTKDLLRFGREQAPRLDRIHQRIRRIGERLERARPPSGE